MATPEAPRDCRSCPRLAAFRDAQAAREPTWFNGAVPSFGDPDGRLAVVGLAPGLRGANRTGRPFTGDYAGDLLYATLTRHGFASGRFEARPDDGLRLVDCLVTNAVRCVPPENKPTGAEIAACRPFLGARLAAMPNLAAVVTLGRIAHDSALRALGARPKDAPFGHGAVAAVGGVTVFASYHCSRYNTNTGRLTAAMFDAVFAAARAHLDGARGATSPTRAGVGG
ncbi:MAG: uracil-DNA glycosylase [Rhodobacteraceae bacterium]|nr:MAG: uracil-DNA glycosylase [Paracoccaceae bacterium]